MRLMLAAVAALAAVALAAPSFAQEAAPTPTPSVKPKPGTTAYCNTLKSTTSKSACLKRVHAQAATPKARPNASPHSSRYSIAQCAIARGDTRCAGGRKRGGCGPPPSRW